MNGIAETLTIEIVKAVPALGVLAWIVHRFLAHLKEKALVDKQIAEACHTVIEKSTTAVNENSKVIGGAVKVMETSSGVMLKVEEIVRHCQRGGQS
jgi:hypothetical protein